MRFAPRLARPRPIRRCRAVLLTGAGRGFCAGQDLSDRVMGEGAEPPDLGRTIETYYSPLVKQLRALPMPIVCAVNGVAAGAGANIALACDIVLAARSASFLEAFARIGLVPDAGGTYFLPRLVGEARARAHGAARRAGAGRDRRELGAHLEMRRRRCADGRGACALRPFRRRRDDTASR